MAATIEELEEKEQYTDDHNESPPADIVAYCLFRKFHPAW